MLPVQQAGHQIYNPNISMQQFVLIHCTLFSTPPKLQTRRNWVSCCHLNGAWCTCLTFACGSVSSTPLGHWQCTVYQAASWKPITTLDHSAEVPQTNCAAAKVGTRVRTAVGPFQWSKAFGWKMRMQISFIGITKVHALWVLFQQHTRRQPRRLPVPYWTRAAMMWKFLSAAPRRRWHGCWTLPSWRATRKLPSTCPRSARCAPCGDAQCIYLVKIVVGRLRGLPCRSVPTFRTSWWRTSTSLVKTFLFHRPCFWTRIWRIGRRSAICSHGAIKFGDHGTVRIGWGIFSVRMAGNCLWTKSVPLRMQDWTCNLCILKSFPRKLVRQMLLCLCWTWPFGVASPTVQKLAWMEASSSGMMIQHWPGTNESCVEKRWARLSSAYTVGLLKPRLLQQLHAVHGWNARGRVSPYKKASSFTRWCWRCSGPDSFQWLCCKRSWAIPCKFQRSLIS